jgi:hypothetical protein
MPGVFMHRNAKKIEIPFERQDNFIIVKVIFGKLFPLRFIVDTGAEHTILTKREISDLLGMEYERTINLVGTDLKTQVTAYIARKARLDLPTITFVKDILVLDQDYFQFDKFAGLDVHGVLGAEAFKGYVLKFDFTKQILTMYDPSVFRTSDHKKYEELPIEIIRSKPYLNTKAQILNDSAVNLKLLIDTGAALSLLLHTYSVPGLFLPPKVIKGNIGTGLGGEIEGFVGRIRSIHVGSHKMGAPVSNFQELNTASDTAYLNRRNGLMGGEILCRFNFIIDFAREKLYIQPNRYFKEAFVYDRSGLILIAGGNLLNTFTVHDIVPHSPAEEAGILRGDEILKINGLIARFYNLGALNQKLQAKVGKTIRLQILRNGQKMNFSFKLRDLV